MLGYRLNFAAIEIAIIKYILHRKHHSLLLFISVMPNLFLAEIGRKSRSTAAG